MQPDGTTSNELKNDTPPQESSLSLLELFKLKAKPRVSIWLVWCFPC